MEEVKATGLAGNQPLPNMITLYRNDIRQYPDSHLDLPMKIAMSVCGGLPKYWPYLMDFIQEGNIELLRCIRVFNERCQGSNDEFRNYAAACIRGVIYNYFAHIPMIYIANRSRKICFIEKGKDEELSLLERMVSFEELYEYMIEIEEPTVMQEAFCKAKWEQIQTLLAQLPTRERQVILMRYGIDGIEYGYDEIASALDLTIEHTRLLKNYAIRRMNGTSKKPARELMERQRKHEQDVQLQAIYEQHQGKITIRELARLSHCNKSYASAFVKERRSLTHTHAPSSA